MKKYFVYEDKMMLAEYNERYVEMRENESAEIVPEEFDTLEEAQAFLNELASAWDKYEIVRTKYGLDTIVYNVAWIEKESYEDGKYIGDAVEVNRVESLPDNVREAAMKHQREYWKFLDYEEDSYAPLDV